VKNNNLGRMVLATLAVFGALIGVAQANDAWDQLLARASNHIGRIWCGTMEGHVQVGPRTYRAVGYQIVQADYEDLVMQLLPSRPGASDTETGGRLLRITHDHHRWTFQETGADPRPFLPSADVMRALRVGAAFGLPSSAIPALQILPGEEIETLQVRTGSPLPFLTGLEGQFRLLVDSRTGVPMKLSAFGLREWQNADVPDYKLALTYHITPGCKKPS
jgi:hypothetical protein